MNNVTLTGRLVRDPEVRYSQSQESMAVARFTLAVDRRRSNNNEGATADFINCVAFGKIAEIFERHTSKGVKVCVRGHIQTGSYTNKDGAKVFTTDIVIDEMEFCESKNSASSNTTSAPAPAPTVDQNTGFMNIPDDIADDLPFN